MALRGRFERKSLGGFGELKKRRRGVSRRGTRRVGERRGHRRAVKLKKRKKEVGGGLWFWVLGIWVRKIRAREVVEPGV